MSFKKEDVFISEDEYVMIEQDKCLVEAYHRMDEIWNHTVYGVGNDIHFNSIGLTLSVEEIYTDVDNLKL